MSAESDQFSFVNSEHEILNFWKEKNIFKKSLDQTKNGPAYIFYDGPPFATGLPHHGHLLASTLKYIAPRYFTMKGHYVERRFGWDCHGLPIENEIDKKLGMSAQKAVEELGVEGYNNECRGIVQKYTSEWEKTISRIGRWVDFENDYKTMDKSFMESVWWVIGRLWEKELIYKGTKVVPFSTKLGTVLSNFEAGLDYRDVQDPAITVLFKLDNEDAYLAAWTTTPWTLPSNLGLCVGPEIDYVLAEDKVTKKKIYIAEERLEDYAKKAEFQILNRLKGNDLKGKTYEPLTPYFKDMKSENCFQVFADNYVTTESGTGIVHIAPAFGEDDNRVMKEAGVRSIVCPVDDAGEFTDEVSDFAGIHVKEADKGIIKMLKEQDKVLEQSVYVHSYPFCYRTGTPLIYRAIPSWYVSVEKIKDQLLASNAQINWVPSHIKDGRFGKWLENARDWAISRNRIWGTPIPVWINDENGNMECIDSIAKLKDLAGIEVNDLHREHVDQITFTKDGEAGTYRRIPEVLDCWFESGSMPYAQNHYPFEKKEVFENGFPAEFIAEGLDQTRGWFYTLTVLSTALFNKPAFKNVIVNGMVLAADGKKMSKSLRNFTAPDELLEKFGADALRLYLINSGLVKAEEQRFTDDGVKDMVRRVLLPWYNSYKFFKTYAEVDGWKADQHFVVGNNITDQWILSKLQTLTKNVTEEMEGYRLYNVVPALFGFIDDLTNWYIRLNRRRFWEEGLTDDKKAAYSTLYETVISVSTLMAPFAPFLSERVFLNLEEFGVKPGEDKKESIHLKSYPVAKDDLIRPKLEDAVGRMQQIILLGRQKRNQVKIKVKTPLKELKVIQRDQTILDEIKKLESYIKTELNVKEVNYQTDEENYINLFAKPNSPILGKKLGKEFGKYRKLISELSQESLLKIESNEVIELDGQVFTPEEILIFREPKEGTETLSNSLISIDIDTTLDEELIKEGLAREVVNRIQKSRKEKGFEVSDRINIKYKGSDKICRAISDFKDYITKETLCESLENSDLAKPEFQFDVDGEDIHIEIENLS